MLNNNIVVNYHIQFQKNTRRENYKSPYLFPCYGLNCTHYYSSLIMDNL